MRDPEKVRRSLEREEDLEIRAEHRLRYIEYALFAGCLTGRRLEAVFSKELCEEIVWEEANPTIAGNPRDYYPPDPEHINAVLDKHKPEAVLTFTRKGQDVIRALCEGRHCVVISGPHPAARHSGVMDELFGMKRALNDLICLRGCVTPIGNADR